MKFKNTIKIFLSIFLIGLFLFHPTKSAASDNYKIDLKSTYSINDDGFTTALYNYRIENLGKEKYIEEFHLNFKNLNPTNIEVKQDDKNIDFKKIEKEEGALIALDLKSLELVGIGGFIEFDLSFSENNISKKNGTSLEISIPKFDDANYDTIETYISVPNSFGDEAYINPLPTEKQIFDDYSSYFFDSLTSKNRNITALFGEHQIYEYSLNFFLENKSALFQEKSIPIPPDTNYQKSYITSIIPMPKNIEIDQDNNWIATYNLRPFSSLEINVKGKVQVFSYPTKIVSSSPQYILNNLETKEFWPVDDKAIKMIANELSTPKKIYDFVIDSFNYDSNKAKNDAVRAGTINALENPNNALCTEYTDAFITLARSANIPAREMQGFAYSQNPSLQPLSLVSDVLHSWPQYWDSSRGLWISIDPTWQDTSGNDYFNNFDMKHITFVIHGKDSSLPLPPGSYKTSKSPKKDVYVTLSTLEGTQSSKTSYTINSVNILNPFKRNIEIEIENKGYASDRELLFSIKDDKDNVLAEKYIDILPPLSKTTISYSLNYGILAKDAPDTIKIDSNFRKSQIETKKSEIIIIQLVYAFLLIAVLILSSVFYIKR